MAEKYSKIYQKHFSTPKAYERLKMRAGKVAVGGVIAGLGLALLGTAKRDKATEKRMILKKLDR